MGLWLIGVPVRVGYAADGRRTLLNPAVSGRRTLAGLHQVFYYLGLLQALGEVDTFVPPTLHLRELEMAAASQLLEAAPGSGPWVGLSPGAAYGPAKRWFPERFAAVAERLIGRFSCPVLLFGGAGDRVSTEAVQSAAQSAFIDIAGRTSLPLCWALVSHVK